MFYLIFKDYKTGEDCGNLKIMYNESLPTIGQTIDIGWRKMQIIEMVSHEQADNIFDCKVKVYPSKRDYIIQGISEADNIYFKKTELAYIVEDGVPIARVNFNWNLCNEPVTVNRVNHSSWKGFGEGERTLEIVFINNRRFKLVNAPYKPKMSFDCSNPLAPEDLVYYNSRFNKDER